MMTPKQAIQLAAPHTWAGSIIPVLLSVAFAHFSQGHVSVTLSIVLLAIAILMQSAVNTLNDYFDFVKGSDTEDDNVEESDAVLVYSDLEPRSALIFAIALIVIAFLLGIYCIVVTGWIPLVVALIGVGVVALYSGGKTPISYLPIGELVSGFVMGGLLTFASFYVLTKQLDWQVLAWSIPLMLGIALIMMTNNACDIEKDIQASRKTLPAMLGRRRTVILYKVITSCWVASIVVIVAIWFAPGSVVLPFMLLATWPVVSKLLSASLIPESRIGAMGTICNANIMLGAFYCISVWASAATLIV